MQVESGVKFLHIRALHAADQNAYVLEVRWVNLSTVPAASKVDFNKQSPNEWLLEHVPVSEGALSFTAAQAGEDEAIALDCEQGDAVFIEQRLTRNAKGASITWVQLVYAPGYQMKIKL